MSGYQVMPRLSADEYADLEQSIKTDGVLVPIIVSPGGEIIDGHHRAEIARKYGIHCPEVVKHGDPTELRTFAYSLNLNRRHLSREQRRELIALSLKQDPGLPDLQHAKRTGASDKTVTSVRRELESHSEIPNETTRVNARGQGRPATYERTPEPLSESPLKPFADKIAAELAASDDNYAEQAATVTPRRLPEPVLSGERLARYDGEKRSSALANACTTLHGLGFPMPRRQYIDAWRDFPEGASPAQREHVGPDQFRTFATTLLTLADEWENTDA